MTFVLLTVTALLVLGALASIRAAWRGTIAARRALARETTPIRALAEGPVEIEGTLHLVGEPIVAPSGRRCVTAKVTLQGRTGAGTKSTTAMPARTVVRSARAVVRDATGEAALDLEHVEIVAPSYAGSGRRAGLEHVLLSWCSDVPASVAHLTIAEAVVEDGARVLVHGRARAIGDEVEAPRDRGYRGGAPTVQRRFALEGAPDDRIVVAAGGQRMLLWRSVWPVLLLLAVGVTLLAHAAVLAAVLRA